MAIFTRVLQLSRQEREMLGRLTVATERVAVEMARVADASVRQADASVRQAVAFETLIAALPDDEPESVVRFKIGPVSEQ